MSSIPLNWLDIIWKMSHVNIQAVFYFETL